MEVNILIFKKHLQTKVLVLAKLFKCILKNLAVQQLSRKTLTYSKLTIKKTLKQHEKNIKVNSFKCLVFLLVTLNITINFIVFLMLSVKNTTFSLSMTTYVNTTAIKPTTANLKMTIAKSNTCIYD